MIFKALLAYIPLSTIGAWRWSYWMVRIFGASLYRSPSGKWQEEAKKPTVTVVTPVYNEDEALFKKALDSWISNGVDEIIAVIDKSNGHLIIEYEKHYVRTQKQVKCRLVVTAKPGKRAALCDGIVRAKGDLIALVDSDTYWGDNVYEKVLPCFLDPAIGGVTVAQRIDNPNTTSNVLFDILLWNRYREEVPFLLGLGKVFNTLSGRTAFYRREAILNDNKDNVHELRHEFFFGTRGISGDDKRLTHLILEQGWRVGYAKGATVYTEGLDKIKPFMKQRLRWTRNSWRADLRATKRGWIWRHPALAYFMIDRFIQPFLMLIGPTAFVVALLSQHWAIAGILLAWWFVSRLIKLFSYFRHYPKRLIYLPAYILYTYVNALLKVYALATIIEHSWATRWHKNRNRKNLVRRMSTIGLGIAGMIVALFFTFNFITALGKESAIAVATPSPVVANQFQTPAALNSAALSNPKEPLNSVSPTQVQIYIIQPGDTLLAIASHLCMDSETLKKVNGIIHPKNLVVGSPIYYFCAPPKQNGVPSVP